MVGGAVQQEGRVPSPQGYNEVDFLMALCTNEGRLELVDVRGLLAVRVAPLRHRKPWNSQGCSPDRSALSPSAKQAATRDLTGSHYDSSRMVDVESTGT